MIETALELLETDGKIYWTVARGESMLPLIRDGDRLQVLPNHDLPSPGDILVFHHKNGLVAHRLLRLMRDAKEDIFYLMQGDHAIHPDPPITVEQVIGRVTALSRGEQYLQLETPTWQRIGRVVSACQSLLIGLKSRSRISRILRRSTRACIGLLLKFFL